MRLLLMTLLLAMPCRAATYFLSPSGSDSNNGTSTGSAWLSPNHAVNCGDVIMAAASTSYSAANFAPSKWGTVTCSAANNVAWLECATFDACKITSTASSGMQVTASYWGVQGWEVTISAAASNAFACFSAIPNSGTAIHHIVFADDIANGCNADGFESANTSSTGYDYIAYVGNIAYNSSQGSAACASGFSFYQPVQHDSLPGTHLYMAGNFSFGNLDPSTCNGTPPTDGEGFIIDTPDWSQHSGTNVPYAAQIVVDGNLAVFNGGRGIQILNNSQGGSPYAHIYVRNNTSYGNNDFTNNAGDACAELYANSAIQTEFYANLSVTASATACSSNPLWGATVLYGDATDHVYSNFVYSSAGNNTVTANSGSFAIGPNNITGTSPSFASPTSPSSPSCGSFSSVPACMAAVIANFTPALAAAQSYGYQAAQSASRFDPLFPQWLCSANLPSGLVTMGCLTGSASSGAARSGSKLQ